MRTMARRYFMMFTRMDYTGFRSMGRSGDEKMGRGELPFVRAGHKFDILLIFNGVSEIIVHPSKAPNDI